MYANISRLMLKFRRTINDNHVCCLHVICIKGIRCLLQTPHISQVKGVSRIGWYSTINILLRVFLATATIRVSQSLNVYSPNLLQSTECWFLIIRTVFLPSTSFL